jgi:hypothetical protein
MTTGKIKISMIKYFLFKIGVLSHVDGEDCKFELPGDSDCEEEVNVDEDGTEEVKAMQQEKREEKKEEGVEEEAPPMPVLVRQVSADPRMPKMIRQRSMEALEIEAEVGSGQCVYVQMCREYVFVLLFIYIYINTYTHTYSLRPTCWTGSRRLSSRWLLT